MLNSRIFTIFFFLWAGQVFAGPAETRKIFAKLVLAIGKNSVSRPVLSIVNDNNLVVITSSSGEIRMGAKLIQHCSSFGADSNNALASLISHELVHYYHEHLWGHKFGNSYENSDWGKKISNLDTSVYIQELHETQADQLGFYYSFSAGYKTWNISALILDSVYKWYDLKEKIEGYPSLRQRKEIIAISASKFAKLIPVFEMSNQLRAISAAYEDDQKSALLDFSGFGYEYLFSQEIQTAEMYNNIAVSKILKAQKYSSSVFSRLQLPLILDQTSMMYEVSHSKGADEQEKFMALMEDAKDNLEKALKLDATYWTAAINKCLVLVGLEDYGGAEFVLNSVAIKGMMKKDKHVEAVIAELRGFISYLGGDSVKSRDWFKSAIKLGSSTARLNESILKGRLDNASNNEEHSITRSDTLEKWNGKMIYQALDIYPTNYDNQIIYLNSCAHLFLDSSGGYKIFELKPHISPCPIQKVKIALNFELKSSTSRGVKIGNTSQELIAKYGEPVKKVLGTSYAYWIYPRQRMIVMVDTPNNKVESWFYYMLK